MAVSTVLSVTNNSDKVILDFCLIETSNELLVKINKYTVEGYCYLSIEERKRLISFLEFSIKRNDL